MHVECLSMCYFIESLRVSQVGIVEMTTVCKL